MANEAQNVGAIVAAWLQEQRRRRIPHVGYDGSGYFDELASGTGDDTGGGPGGGGGGGGSVDVGPGGPGIGPDDDTTGDPGFPDDKGPGHGDHRDDLNPKTPPDPLAEDLVYPPRNSPPVRVGGDRPGPPPGPRPYRDYSPGAPRPPQSYQQLYEPTDPRIETPGGGPVDPTGSGGVGIYVPEIPGGVDPGASGSGGAVYTPTPGTGGAGGAGAAGGTVFQGGASFGDPQSDDDDSALPLNSSAKAAPEPITDNFANYEIDNIWYATYGDWTEAPGFLDCTAGGGPGPIALLRCVPTDNYTDCRIMGTVRAPQTAQMMLLMGRVSLDGGGNVNGYAAYHVTAGNFITLLVYNASVTSVLGTFVQALTPGDTIELVCSGTNIDVLYNGASVIGVVDATHAAGFCAVGVSTNLNANDWTNLTITP